MIFRMMTADATSPVAKVVSPAADGKVSASAEEALQHRRSRRRLRDEGDDLGVKLLVHALGAHLLRLRWTS